MNEPWFRARLSGLQKQCDEFLSQDLTPEQVTVLGGELQAQIERVLERVRSREFRYGQR